MSIRTLLLLAVVGIVLFMLFGHTNQGFWNLNIPYPAGVTTNAADVMPGQTGRPWNGSGLPPGQYVGNDWTAQPFGG